MSYVSVFQPVLIVICFLGLGFITAYSSENDPAIPSPLDATQPCTPTEIQASQEAWAKHLKTKVVERNSIGIELVLVPPGQLIRGDNALVTLTRPFSVGKTEVTQGQWRAIMGSEPWKGKPLTREGTDHAATCISWQDARLFCAKLGKKEGAKYRLLSEAEWEYTCRAGTQTRFCFGDDEAQLREYAWFQRNASGEDYAHPVGLKLPNAFGLHDMHGNAWEWCQDSFSKTVPAGENPLVSLENSDRVLRGGSWYSEGKACRSTERVASAPTDRSFNVGFRVVLVR